LSVFDSPEKSQSMQNSYLTSSLFQHFNNWI
jgi:hypothetical protein